MQCQMNAGAGVLIALALMSSPLQAQTDSHVGMRVGYNFRAEEAMLSAHMLVPMTSRIYFYPSLDVYTPEKGNRIGFNGDVKVALPGSPGRPQFYAGAGVGIMNRNEEGFSNSDVGANLLMGIESVIGWIRPFAEAKFMIYDRSQFQMVAGINIRMR
jgi:hypothetical protein